MQDKEILKKAIEIAIENGYVLPEAFGLNRMFMEDRFQLFKGFFSHDFAKAFFGGKGKAKFLINLNEEVHNFYTEEHIFHLMKMVGFSNPIDYLRKFIDNTENPKSK